MGVVSQPCNYDCSWVFRKLLCMLLGMMHCSCSKVWTSVCNLVLFVSPISWCDSLSKNHPSGTINLCHVIVFP